MEQQITDEQKHIHAHTIKFEPIVADNPKYNSEKFGFRAFAVRVCECGDRTVLRYGERKDIEAWTERQNLMGEMR